MELRALLEGTEVLPTVQHWNRGAEWTSRVKVGVGCILHFLILEGN